MIAEPTDDPLLAHLKVYATQRAALAWRALHPPEGATGREKAIMMIVGFSDADEATAGYLLDRCPSITDEVLDDDQRRDAICLVLINSVAAVSYTEQ